MTIANHTGGRTTTDLRHSDWAGVAVIGLAFCGLLVFFWNGITAMVASWAQPEYSFGPLVPLVSAYMLLHEMRQKPPTISGGSRWPGFALVLLGLAIGHIGNLSQIPYLIAYGFIAAIGGLALVVAGIRQGLSYWPGWVHLLFMLPLPNFLYWQLSGYLQLVSSKIGVEVIYSLGIPVFLEGNIIDLGVYKLQVAEACSGLRYLFPLMSFGYLFAVLYRGPLWQKLALFLLTIPITVLMNSFRIGVIGVLVDAYGIGQAEGFLHFFEGWIIFLSCVVILYIVGLLLQLLRKHPETGLNILDLDFDGLVKPLGWSKAIPASAALLAAAAAILVAGAAWHASPARPTPHIERESFKTFPMQMGKWNGTPGTLEDWTVKVLAADEYLLADFEDKETKRSVNLFASFYFSTSDGTGIHSPQICIPGSGWEVFNWQQRTVSPEGAAPFAVNRALIQKGQAKQIVYYWFEQRGRRLAGEMETKLYTVWDSASRGRADGALIRIITPVHPGEGEAAADKRLEEFLSPALGMLPRYIPG